MFKNIYSSSNDPRLRFFQYRLLHRTIVTNKNLFQWKIKPSAACTFCITEDESLMHLFLKCRIVSDLWSRLFSWMDSKTDISITFPDVDILLGIADDAGNNWAAHNTIFTLTKKYIYKCRCLGTCPNFNELLSILLYEIHIEKVAATNCDKMYRFHSKWAKFSLT